ncbi:MULTISPECIES: MerR family transcriptional regulator [unclassified Streptomyces]|uniref:MerR family transcriptional regulator n=1 Tax=unclassified Streptomyces TaxID=2593676 RepID=UPI0033F16F46
MRLAELSERSGVSAATIKYYLREGLLPPGERITATQADYDASHLRRLKLVRALIQVGRVPVAAAKEVLAALEDDALDHHTRLGVAVEALPNAPEPGPDDPHARAARASVDALIEELGWQYGGSDPAGSSGAYRTLLTAVTALARLGYPCGPEELAPYAAAAAQLAVTDLDLVERGRTPAEQVEAAVALTVLYEPVLLSLRRLAQAQESARRFVRP